MESATIAAGDDRPESDARAIVVGSYGESPLRSAILGSTPHRFLHGALRPVIVVPVAATGGE